MSHACILIGVQNHPVVKGDYWEIVDSMKILITNEVK